MTMDVENAMKVINCECNAKGLAASFESFWHVLITPWPSLYQDLAFRLNILNF